MAPVLELNEVNSHPHNKERDLLVEMDGVTQPAPAPRLSRTPGSVKGLAKSRGSETKEVLEALGYARKKIKALFEKEIVE